MPYKNPEDAKKQCKDYHIKHRKEIYKQKQRRINECKDKIMYLLGNKCANPNCPILPEKLDKRALQIDHIHGGGNKEKKNFSGREGYYGYILKQIKSGSKDYQLLCAYCNWIKRFESGVIP